eukprot:m51a1_g11984 hypothetical protein (258) ;mRNA; r:869247-870136
MWARPVLSLHATAVASLVELRAPHRWDTPSGRASVCTWPSAPRVVALPSPAHPRRCLVASAAALRAVDLCPPASFRVAATPALPPSASSVQSLARTPSTSRGPGCAQRCAVTSGRVVALEWAIGAGGLSGAMGCVLAGCSDRSVQALDMSRSGSLAHAWGGATKCDISDIVVSRADPSVIFVSSVDTEVSCGVWDQDKRRNVKKGVLRVDSPVAGIDLCTRDDGTDVLWAYTANATIYAWEHPELASGEHITDVDVE